MTTSEILMDLGEPFMAGFSEEPTACYQRRFARAIRRVIEATPPRGYAGGRLYPAGEGLWHIAGACCQFHYSSTFELDVPGMAAKINGRYADKTYPWYCAHRVMGELAMLRRTDIPGKFCLGGDGWTHAVMDYRTALREGLDGILTRIDRNYSRNPDFFAAEREVVAALKGYVSRCREKLRETGAPQVLLDALAQVPERGARNLYEAMVAYNFFWYMDGSDSGGRVTDVLNEYSGDAEDIEGLFREMWTNFDICDGWHVLFDDRVPLTLAAIRAQHGIRRPNSGLLVDEDTPDEVWNAVFDNWQAGTVSPNLYSRKNYGAHVKDALHVRDDDAEWFCYGGCTELMLQGCSHVGSLEAGIHVLEILQQLGLEFDSFDDLMAAFWKAFDTQLDEMVAAIRRYRDTLAPMRPNPIRTLFFNDCLDAARDYNGYGARYNASDVNVVGLTNLVNSLYAIRMAYDGRLSVNVHGLADALAADFPDETLRRELLALPKFGNGDDRIDDGGAAVINEIFRRIRAKSTDRLPILPGVIMFVTYAQLGLFVGATADGRHAQAPVADSFGAMQGTDFCGPTALLRSASLPVQSTALATLVLNIRLDQSMLATPEARQLVKALVLTYFQQGGLQLQATVADQAVLAAALAHPEDYPNLIVRIGGYSEYFQRLSRALQQEVAKRTVQRQ